MADFKLPEHLKQKSEKWFLNEKTGKFIHAERIEAFCKRYWRNRSGTKAPATKYKRNVKAAQRRWANED